MRSYILLFLLVCVIGIGGAVFLYEQKEAPLTTAALRIDIERQGPEAAYRVLKKRLADASPEAQHNAAHLFGGVLYAVRGMSGVVVCDHELTYGCFHQILGEAIRDYGIEGATVLNDVCMQLGTPAMVLACQHGLGHGLESAFGYDEAALLKTLELCTHYGKQYEGVRGCGGGAFMEFNMRTMLDGLLRPVENNDVAYPCTVLPAAYRNGCFYWQPQWWLARAFEKQSSVSDAFREVAHLCTAHGESSEEVQLCLAGLGKLIEAAYDRDYERTLLTCAAITSTDADALSCGLRVLTSARQHAENPVALCTLYTDDERVFCEAYVLGGDEAIRQYRVKGASVWVSEELLHRE